MNILGRKSEAHIQIPYLLSLIRLHTSTLSLFVMWENQFH